MAEIIPFPTERTRPPGSPPPARQELVCLAATATDPGAHPPAPLWTAGPLEFHFDFTGVQGDGGTVI